MEINCKQPPDYSRTGLEIIVQTPIPQSLGGLRGNAKWIRAHVDGAVLGWLPSIPELRME